MATHRSVLLDHQSIVDGVSVREKKDLTITINDETGVEEYYLTTTRFIGDKSFTTKQSITDDEEKEESISAAASGWAGWVEFGSSVNPITTRGADYAQRITASPPGFENLAAALSIETEMDDSELESFKDEWKRIKELPKLSISKSVCKFCGNIQEIDEPCILTRCLFSDFS